MTKYACLVKYRLPYKDTENLGILHKDGKVFLSTSAKKITERVYEVFDGTASYTLVKIEECGIIAEPERRNRK